ncbi:MAG: sugar transferase [Candidatus Colwellbacteria bacterium]|nr:sugar transferase [Candidatus Colwellbacteria bacterium]
MGADLSYPAWKRVTDIFGAIVGMAVFAPFFPIVIAAIKVDTRGPAFVRCKRISGGREIEVYKFRSMVKDAAEIRDKLMPLNERADGPFFKIKNDPRVTRVGRVIRKFRIDEFPQLFNVLKGEMALVGPRPHEPQEVSKYPEEYAHIALCTAGLTGLSQVSGASSLNWLKELSLDDFYVKNRSPLLDMKIMARTIAIFVSDPTGV